MVTYVAVPKANQIRDILFSWCFGCLFLIRDMSLRQNVMRDASKFFLLQKPPSADLLWLFTHMDMAPN